MPSNAKLIAEGIQTIIVDEVLVDLVDELVLAESDVPAVRLAKRITQHGREEDTIRIRDGITIAPIHQAESGGTNERDDVAYRFWLAIGYGTQTDELEDYWPLASLAQALRRRFNQTRTGVTGLIGCELATTIQSNADLPNKEKLVEQIDATVYRVTVWVRETRRRYV
jgi:hypothetical protein